MCPICGTLLELSEAPQAKRQRAFIRQLIARGRSKEEIKDALVAEYGSEVLATPGDSGFDLAAWVVPVAALVLAAGALGIGVRRWRGARAGGEAVSPPSEAEARRLDEDIAHYDL
jgi:cytochrome c-type biogenesis protein CcmH/NrfF